MFVYCNTKLDYIWYNLSSITNHPIMKKLNISEEIFLEYNPDLYAQVIEHGSERLLHIKLWKTHCKKLIQGQGWVSLELPLNTISNNNLYLPEISVDYLFGYLQEFIDTAFIESHNINIPPNYQIQNFKDINENKISLQNSSSATPKIWFGYVSCELHHMKDNNIFPLPEEFQSAMMEDRLHLDKKRAKQVLKFLQNVWNEKKQ